MSTETLTSLAMLKVNIDQDQDYFDYLRPFVIQVLLDEQLEAIQEGVINKHIRAKFGLQIPTKTVQLVLKRLTDDGFLKKRHGKYQIKRDLPDTNLTDRKHEVEAHINAVISGLMQFADTLGHPFSEEDAATTAICAFLSEFNIQCLRAYQGNTIIPSLSEKHEADIVLVSKYIIHIQAVSIDQFNSFIRMVEGHMCANALLCPDLKNAPQTYEDVTFYFDTPLLIPLTGMNGTASETAVRELLALLHKLGGKTAMFSHSKQEVENVLHGTANNLYYGYGKMIAEVKRRKMSRSDLLDIAARIDEIFNRAKIELVDTPSYDERKFQINELRLSQFLDREVLYHKRRTQEYDINSVRSIYVLRRGSCPTTIEDAKAVLVTSNQAFARGAWQYGQKHERRNEMATVVTDFSLANIAWLKAPMNAPELPQAEILALCHAAVHPREDFIDEFLEEVDKLAQQKDITEQRLQALRSISIYDSLMALTLGSRNALTKDNINKIADDYEQKVQQGVRKRYEAEKQKIQTEVNAAHRQLLRAREVARKKSRGKAQACVWSIIALTTLLLLAGILFPILSGFGVLPQSFLLNLNIMIPVLAISLLAALFTFLNLCWGTTVRGLYRRIYNGLYYFFLKRKLFAMGIDFEEFPN